MEDTTRRSLMTAVTAGAATAFATSTPAQQEAQAHGGMQNPRTKYPQPPFPAQS